MELKNHPKKTLSLNYKERRCEELTRDKVKVVRLQSHCAVQPGRGKGTSSNTPGGHLAQKCRGRRYQGG